MKLLITILLCLPFFTEGQTISTIAGNGVNANTGDGGPATSAALWYPWGVATDTASSIYITGSYYTTSAYRNVRKISPSGVITNYAGNGSAGFSGDGGPATAAAISYPMGIAHDLFGNLYILDWNNFRIRKVNASGIISTVAGNGVSGFSGDGGPATSASLYAPYAIACDVNGNVCFAQYTGSRIRKLDTFGYVSTIAGTGTSGFSGDGGPATNAEMSDVYGITTDPAGNIYFCDYSNHRIRKISTGGIITTVAGTGTPGFSGDGGAATAAQINGPLAIVMDQGGNLNFCDFNNNRVRRINSAGVISTVTGSAGYGFGGDGGPATAAIVDRPSGLGVVSGGNLVFSDWNNYRMRLLTSAHDSPLFTGGHLQHLLACVNESPMPVSINALLTAMDSVAGLTEIWTLVTPPAHGVAVAGYSITSTGAILIPTGLTYTPVSGYTGPDTFKAAISNGGSSDTTTIAVSVNLNPQAGIISGIDSICPGQMDSLHVTATAGTWHIRNSLLAGISDSGIVAGFLPGADTAVYTDSNVCGTASAYFPFTVKSYVACHTAVYESVGKTDDVRVFPIPAAGIITVSYDRGINRLQVFNIAGQEIEFARHLSTEVQLDISLLPSGMYFLKINGTIPAKFIKE